jgi:hypothetical protein
LSFAEYIAHGWKLCAIQPGEKRPSGPGAKGWNRPERAITNPGLLVGMNAGLCHAWSGTCAIDIDNIPVAEAWLAARGVIMSTLLEAPDCVRISSGRPGRAKLIYSLQQPLQSIKTAPFPGIDKNGKEMTFTALDFRSATREGFTVQDVLPPSIHPDTGLPYRWEYGDELLGSWRCLPELPDELRRVWESLIVERAAQPAGEPLGAGFEEIRELLKHQDPNAAYNDWIRVGCALHHETRGSREGLLLWDEWSQQASEHDKYKGIADLEPHWRSFNATTANAVTLGTLRSEAVATVEDFAIVPVSTTPPSQLTPEGRRKFQRLPFEDFINGPPPEWIVHEVLPRGAIGVVYGGPGSGKSFWTTDLGLHVADGREWRGRAVKRTKTAYLIAEGVAGGRVRLRAARTELNFDTSDFEIIEDTPNFLDKADPPALARELHGVGLVIVDTLAQTIPGADENSGKDMSIMLEHCKLIHKATGAMVLLIAHSGKDQERGMRGWSGVKGALDVEIEVTTDGEQFDANRVAKVTKQKDGETGAEFGFKLRKAHGSLVVDHTEAPKKQKPRVQRGPVESLAWESLTSMLPPGSGVGVELEKVVTDMAAKMAHDTGTDKKDRRRERAAQMLERLAAEGRIRLHDGTVYTADMPVFDPHPVRHGIDSPEPAVQDHSDLLGAPHG